ncbi:hypothetical protein UlMin_027800 [Ulmus minor]
MAKIKSFKFHYSFDTFVPFLYERLQESRNMIAKYPDRVPVIIEKYSRTDLPDMEKQKHDSWTVHILSSRLHLAPGKAVLVFVNDNLPQIASCMDKEHQTYKDEDGFLYMCYSSEKTFG